MTTGTTQYQRNLTRDGFRYGFGGFLGVTAASILVSVFGFVLWYLVVTVGLTGEGPRSSYKRSTPDYNPSRVKGAAGQSAAERFGWTEKTTGGGQ